MKTITLAMIVRDEERCLGRCISSVRHLVDRIVFWIQAQLTLRGTSLDRWVQMYMISFGAKTFQPQGTRH